MLTLLACAWDSHPYGSSVMDGLALTCQSSLLIKPASPSKPLQVTSHQPNLARLDASPDIALFLEHLFSFRHQNTLVAIALSSSSRLYIQFLSFVFPTRYDPNQPLFA
ncbi:hypothetical protein ASPBRDRAFT_241950 [Aspergillus brasiliensis CBS 101740]|uniref:Uncharacterized protein n=1 Tax=Aspergillus brasiliensis (strain CBS 101740 / IMI 381727 / IBT 21946) TaxID=767769 RepID=A0A1L9V0V1_ASPBC|nr:hypothetical protein ASPBRDRAFT_241950 [Aspergillus brasiliensis CBS 101740]